MARTRRPHAIHGLRALMKRANSKAEAALERAPEMERLLSESAAGGGLYHHHVAAMALLADVVADLKSIALDTAVIEHAPGHTMRRRSKANDNQPALLEAAAPPKRAVSRGM